VRSEWKEKEWLEELREERSEMSVERDSENGKRKKKVKGIGRGEGEGGSSRACGFGRRCSSEVREEVKEKSGGGGMVNCGMWDDIIACEAF